MKSVDVTARVRFGDNDGGSLPLTRCVCGRRYNEWDHVLSVYPETPHECDGCGRKLYFVVTIQVYEVVE